MGTLLDLASLVMIPSGYKEDKLYSVKPTDGSGDFTFSRGTDTATRVNSSGLIEKERVNLALHSEDATNVIYAKTNVSVTANTTTAPDGSLTADTITATTNSASIQGVVSVSTGTRYTMSVYLKRKTGTGQIALRGVSNTTTNITITNDWERYEVPLTALDANGRYGVYLATNGDEVYAWGFQLNYGEVATDYIETTSAAVYEGITDNLPRLDYSGGASCPSLLLEGSRTNVLPHSEYFGDSGWTKTNGTVSISNEISPEGKINAYRFTESTGTINPSIRQNLAASTTTDVTLSVFAKPNGRNYLYLALTGSDAIIFNISNGTIGTTLGTIDSYAITDMGNGWYRCSATKSTNQRDANFGPKATNAFGTYTGDGVSGVDIYGAMIEEGSYPTSYIPTYGASASRAADSCSKTGISDLIGQTEGVLFIDFIYKPVFDNTQSTYRVSLSDGTYNKRVLIYPNDSNTLDILINGVVFTGSSYSLVEGQRYKVALAYGTTSVCYINGAEAFGYGSGAPVGGYTQFQFSDAVNASTRSFNGPINQSLLFKTRLSNDELAALTTI